jgi:uncharacterized integral membrane protein
MVLLVVILVFIVQNQKQVKASFFAWHWTIPLAVDLLFAAVLGGAIVLAATSLRVLQHRRVARMQARRQPGPPQESR